MISAQYMFIRADMIFLPEEKGKIFRRGNTISAT